jgi:hypothetical protein
VCKKKRAGNSWAGGGELAGPCGPACAHALTLGGRKADGLGWFAGLREKEREGGGPAGPKEKGERGLGIFLFKNSFQIHFSNFQTSLKQETMHSNHDAQALVILTLSK